MSKNPLDAKPRIDARLTQGMDGDQRRKFTQEFFGVTHVTDKIRAIVEQELESSRDSAPSDYESPGWAYRRADKDGYIRGLKLVLALLP